MVKSEKIRLFIQICFATLSNGYLKGFYKGKIYQGDFKYLCNPGLNCYSCPASLTSCPIGSLQAVLSNREYKFSLYVLGFIGAFGIISGRFICGFLCPFGLVQDLLFKIPIIKKIRNLPGEKFLRFLRFIILAVFVIILPLAALDITGLGFPWFCKYICPTGTLEGGIPLVLLNKSLQSAAGFLFKWKVFILFLTVIFSIIIYRPFCRYICPLGAIYGIFNKFSFYRYRVASEKCIKCGECEKSCNLSIRVWENPDSIDCIRCGKCKSACPTGAISSGFVR